jgi:Zn-dependent alcohol dehydrogenase
MEAWMPVEFCGGSTLTGSAMGAITPRDIPRTFELYQARILKPTNVTGHFMFDQITRPSILEKGGVIRKS